MVSGGNGVNGGGLTELRVVEGEEVDEFLDLGVEIVSAGRDDAFRAARVSVATLLVLISLRAWVMDPVHGA